MRKYPPVPVLHRICKNDYKIPDTDLTLPKNTEVKIAVLAMHHDETYFPNPQKFDPDRFSDENKHNIPHYAYLPFGKGPRNCIGTFFF